MQSSLQKIFPYCYHRKSALSSCSKMHSNFCILSIIRRKNLIVWCLYKSDDYAVLRLRFNFNKLLCEQLIVLQELHVNFDTVCFVSNDLTIIIAV